MTTSAMPLLDPSVRYVGISKLRDLNASKLKDTKETLVLQDNDIPLAVLLSYENYMVIQQKMAALMSTLELFSDRVELEGVLRGLKDIGEGKVHSFADVKATLKERYAKINEEE
jgi:hypothetical protein